MTHLIAARLVNRLAVVISVEVIFSTSAINELSTIRTTSAVVSLAIYLVGLARPRPAWRQRLMA